MAYRALNEGFTLPEFNSNSVEGNITTLNDVPIFQRPSLVPSATPNLPPTSEQLDHRFRPYKIQASCALKCGWIYLQVFVLLLSWEDEDPRLPVLQEIDQLCDVFERIYHFKVERWRIPSDDSHRRLNHKVLSFVGEDVRDHLKIVYYAGHGRLSYNRQSVWANHYIPSDPRYRIVKWGGIQQSLEQAQSDVLLLIDSCDSGTANTDEGHGVTELLCAAGFNVTANGVGAYSFTHALITELRLLSNGRPFTIDRLYNRMLSRAQNCIPVGEEYQEPFEILPKERHVTPVHVVLTEDSSCISRRIQLRPILLKSTEQTYPQDRIPSPPFPRTQRKEDTLSVSLQAATSSQNALELWNNVSISAVEKTHLETVKPQTGSIQFLKDTQQSLQHTIAVSNPHLDEYDEKLKARGDDLFATSDDASLSIWESQSEGSKYREKKIYSIQGLQFQLESRPPCKDSHTRLIFITATQPGRRLNVSRTMLTYILTKHNVMPAFLDFLFHFYLSKNPQTLNFNGFHCENRFEEIDGGHNQPNLESSTPEIHMCYVLRLIEQPLNSDQNPSTWPIRFTVTYHSFDVDSGNAFWISEGGELIQDCLRDAPDIPSKELEPLSAKDRTFQNSLQFHMMNCQWAAKNWHCYLRSLEEELGDIASRNITSEMNLQDKVSFSDLQHIQSIEDKVNQVILLLNANIDVMEELKESYQQFVPPEAHKRGFGASNKRSVKEFLQQTTDLSNYLQTQISKARICLRLTSCRKKLVYEILEYQSIAMSKTLAELSKTSASKIEKIAAEMDQLAKKSKQETMSMKIITLVTLFFLPGTFISTIMSADIVSLESPKVFQRDTWKLFVSIGVPLVVFTFALFGMIYKLESRKPEKKRKYAGPTDFYV